MKQKKHEANTFSKYTIKLSVRVSNFQGDTFDVVLYCIICSMSVTLIKLIQTALLHVHY